MKSYLILALLSAGAAAFAQVRPPEIPYDSVPNFLKLPANLYLGEVAGVAVNSKGHVFVFSRGNTTGPAYGAAAAQLLEFGPDGKFIREIGKNLYAWSYAHAVRDRQGRQHLGRRQRLGHDRQVQSRRARRRWCSDARRKRPMKPAAVDARHSAAPAVDGQFRQPTDVTWDTRGQYFHQRRLHQLARGEVRQERRLGEVSGANRETSRANSTRRTASRPMRRATSMLPIAATAAFRYSIPTAQFLREMNTSTSLSRPMRGLDGQRARTGDTPVRRSPARPGQSASPRVQPIRCCTCSDAFPGRIYKLTLDGKVLGRWQVRQAAEAIRLDPRDRVPFGKRTLRRRDFELAGAEAHFASGEIGS